MTKMTENEAKEWIKYLGNQNLPYDRSPKSRKLACDIAIQALEENQQYRAIGTVEEFKALKEKSVAKKPTPIDYEKYIDVVKNAKFLRGAYWCPNCKHTVMSGAYCNHCGQKLDWQ